MISSNSFAALALAISFAGVVGLFAVSLLTEPIHSKICELEGLLNQRVRVEAIVKSAFVAKNTLFISLNDGNAIRAIVFSPSREQREIARKENEVIVIGKVAEYKGELEIIAETLRRKND